MKKIIGKIKLQIFASKANPAPPIGPALGQRGINIQEFCRQFNEQTQNQDPGIKLPVVITAYSDRTFSFIVKAPTASDLLKKYTRINKGSVEAGRSIISSIKREDILEIANIKFTDMGLDEVNSAIKSIEGTARSMGISITD